MLTPAKQGIFRPLVAKAWRAHSARIGVATSDKAAQDKWYRKVLLNNVHVYTTNEIKEADQFDAACLAFATIVGDEREIDYWVRAPERRMMYLIRDRLSKIAEIEGKPCDWTYAKGVAEHMELPGSMGEMPEEGLKKVFIAIDRHLQRLRKRGASSVHVTPKPTVDASQCEIPF